MHLIAKHTNTDIDNSGHDMGYYGTVQVTFGMSQSNFILLRMGEVAQLCGSEILWQTLKINYNLDKGKSLT